MFDKLFEKSGLSLDRLRNFLLIVEAGSIAIAAEREPSRQSLLSRQVRDLEGFFGVELSRRNGKTIEITEAGHELAAIVRRCFHEMQDYLLSQQQSKKLIRIGSGYSTSQWIINPKSQRLASILNSEIDMVRMRSRDIATSLRSGEIDLAVVRADAFNRSSDRFVSHMLGKSSYSLFSVKGKKLPLAIPTGGGQFETELLEAIEGIHADRIRCSSLIQMASLVIAEQSEAVLPDVAGAMFEKMYWIESKPFKPLRKYRREWVLAASSRQLEARGIDASIIKQAAKLLSF